MSDSAQNSLLPPQFSGRVRLFPLPNLVMFPHVLQPLHAFEPRYVELVKASLADDQLIAMALLQPGWESQYEGRPPVHSVVCVTRVVAHGLTDEGRYNLLLQGVRRAAIVRELSPDGPFRIADVAVLEDLYPAATTLQRSLLRKQLLDRLCSLPPETSIGYESFEQVYGPKVSLGALLDIISFSLDLAVAVKQALLSEWNVDRRASMLLKRLHAYIQGESAARRDSVFPPDFSSN